MKLISKILVVYFSALGFDLQANNNLGKINELADYIEISVENQNPYYINKAFNFDELGNNVIVKRPDLDEFNQSFLSNISATIDPGNYIINRLTQDGSYSLVSNYSYNNKHKLIYRLISPQGVDYHEYTLSKTREEWFITDIYLYYDAISLENMISRFYQVKAISENYEAFSSSEILELTNTMKLEKKLMTQLLKRNYKRMLAIWKKQPDDIKYKDEVFHFALRALSYYNPEELGEILDQSNLDNQKKNQLCLTILDGLYEQQNYFATLNFIDQLDSAINIDPYLNLFRASVYKAINDSERTKWCLNEVISHLPDEEAGYIGLLELYLDSDQFINATRILNQMTEHFGLYKSDLEVILEKYPGFTESSEYASWRQE